jgi:hypothetical protein
MRVSMLVRSSTVLAAVLLVAACADTATAPPPAARPRLSDKMFEQWLLDNGGPGRDGRGRENKTNQVSSQDFVIDPTQPASLKAGDHIVSFPANSICDPATSGYGEDLWDAPCSPLQQPITIHATWTSKYGHAYVDFQPALRFVPTSDPSQYVTISMKDYWNFDASKSYPIFWQRPSDGVWVDEGMIDESMSTITDLNGNRVSRRIKHFSGYLVGPSEICDAWSSSSCASVMSFAGYMIGGM